MSAEYLISSLQPIPFDGPAPVSRAEFRAACRRELGFEPLSAGDNHAAARAWRDLETQLGNTCASERAKALGVNGDKYLRPADGCSLFWRGRIAAAFAEADPLRRQSAIDRVYWDAAQELTPAADPLAVGAAYTYLVRLGIAERRARISAAEGNSVFDRISDAQAMATR